MGDKAKEIAREKAACLGASTKSHREFMEHMEECRLCHSSVRRDLVSHPFFGFAASCDTNAIRREATK